MEERLECELKVIGSVDAASQVLLHYDLAAVARQVGIPLFAIGSAGGSLVCYCLGLSVVDPIRHNLLFERFLNPARNSFVDILLDTPESGRHKLVGYLMNKYGDEAVVPSAAFRKRPGVAAFKMAAKAAGVPTGAIRRIAKAIGTDSIAVLRYYKRLNQLARGDRRCLKALGQALVIEDLIVTVGVSKGTFVFRSGGSERLVPLQTVERCAWHVAQYDMGVHRIAAYATIWASKQLDEMMAAEHAASRQKAFTAPPHCGIDEPTVHELIASGEGIGHNEFDMPGMRRLRKQFAPTTVDELALLSAIYRPGPMEHIKALLRRRHGKEPVPQYDPLVDEVLAETYGIPVYQEQLMMIMQLVGRFTLAEADLARRALAKRKAADVAKVRAQFIAGARRSGIKKPAAERIYGELLMQANYAFNKAHALHAAYMACRTAWATLHGGSK
jgi:DNA polymerase-3 subunit alpha